MLPMDSMPTVANGFAIVLCVEGTRRRAWIPGIEAAVQPFLQPFVSWKRCRRWRSVQGVAKGDLLRSNHQSIYYLDNVAKAVPPSSDGELESRTHNYPEWLHAIGARPRSHCQPDVTSFLRIDSINCS